MKIVLYFLFSLLSVTFLSADAFQQGVDAYHSSEYAQAATFFEQAIEEEESAASHHNLALALYQTQQVSRAAWHLERALVLNPLNEEYHFKLGALRQALSLPNRTPEWYLIASRLLTPAEWLLALSVAFWVSLGAFLLPRIGNYATGLPIKALRFISLCALLLSGAALFVNRDLPARGILVIDTPSALHAAPAKAAPQTGLARPGERGVVVDQYGDYFEILTEGEARGWIRQSKFRKILGPS